MDEVSLNRKRNLWRALVNTTMKILFAKKQISSLYSQHIHVCHPSYPARKAHAPYYIVVCGFSASTISFYIISQATQFSEKKITEHITYFDFLYNFF